MIKKPDNWDVIEPSSNEFEKLPAGGYVCKIMQAQETISKKGKPMLVLLLDIAQGKYKGYFAKRYELSKKYNPDTAKWSRSACSYHVHDTEDDWSRFRAMLNIVIKCNPELNWEWDEQILKNKKVGVIFREREYINNNGQTRTTLEVYQLHDIEGVEDVPVPEKKTLDPPSYTNSFGSAVDPNEEVPF